MNSLEDDAVLDERTATYLSLGSSIAVKDPTYWMETVFAAGIATLGLILNSPAVIIGAMLISPLMGPILAGGLALAAGDLVMAFRAGTKIFASCVVSIAFATMLVAILPFREMTAEIAARTSPNTLDLGVALFSGAVGAIAVWKSVRGVATSLPGVAIAVALMPPLCVVGYGLGLWLTIDRAQGESVIRGGGLLFLTNLIAITFASMIVFLVVHIDSEAVKERVRTARLEDREHMFFRRGIERINVPDSIVRIGSRPGRIILAAAFVLMIAVPLTRSFVTLNQELRKRQHENLIQKTATNLWQQSFTGEEGRERSFIDVVTAGERAGRISVTMRVFTNRPYSGEERARFIQELARALGRSQEAIQLTLTEIPTSSFEGVRETVTRAAAPQPVPLPELRLELSRRIADAVATMAMPPTAQVVSHEIAIAADGVVVTVLYVAGQEVSADAAAMIETGLRRRLGDAGLTVSMRRVESPATPPAVDATPETPGRPS